MGKKKTERQGDKRIREENEGENGKKRRRDKERNGIEIRLTDKLRSEGSRGREMEGGGCEKFY